MSSRLSTPEARLARAVRAGVAAEARGIRMSRQLREWHEIVGYQITVTWEEPDPQTSVQREAYTALMRGKPIRYRGPWRKRSQVFTVLGDADAKVKALRAGGIARLVSQKEEERELCFGDERWGAAWEWLWRWIASERRGRRSVLVS